MPCLSESHHFVCNPEALEVRRGSGQQEPSSGPTLPSGRQPAQHPYLDEAALLALQGAEPLAQVAVALAQPRTLSLQLCSPGQQPRQLLSQRVQQLLLLPTSPPWLGLMLTQCLQHRRLGALKAGEAVGEVRAAWVDEDAEV